MMPYGGIKDSGFGREGPHYAIREMTEERMVTIRTSTERKEAAMPTMKGGELIAETLVQEKVPYVFGICGHGNVGILDALYDVRDKLKLISPRHEQCAGHMADAYFRVKHQPVATLTSTGPGLGQHGDVAGHRVVGFLGVHGDHRQRADLAAQPRAVPGTLQAQPGRLRAGAAAGGQARVPADARGHAAAGAAPGLRHHLKQNVNRTKQRGQHHAFAPECPLR